MQASTTKFKDVMKSYKQAIRDAESAQSMELTAARRAFNALNSKGRKSLTGGGGVSAEMVGNAEAQLRSFNSDVARWNDIVSAEGFHSRSDELDALNLKLLGYKASPFGADGGSDVESHGIWKTIM